MRAMRSPRGVAFLVCSFFFFFAPPSGSASAPSGFPPGGGGREEEEGEEGAFSSPPSPSPSPPPSSGFARGWWLSGRSRLLAGTRGRKREEEKGEEVAAAGGGRQRRSKEPTPPTAAAADDDDDIVTRIAFATTASLLPLPEQQPGAEAAAESMQPAARIARQNKEETVRAASSNGTEREKRASLNLADASPETKTKGLHRHSQKERKRSSLSRVPFPSSFFFSSQSAMSAARVMPVSRAGCVNQSHSHVVREKTSQSKKENGQCTSESLSLLLARVAAWPALSSVSLSLSRSLCFSSTHVSCPLSIAMHSQQDPLYRLCGQEASAPGAARRAQCCAGIGRSPLPGTVVADDDDAEE